MTYTDAYGFNWEEKQIVDSYRTYKVMCEVKHEVIAPYAVYRKHFLEDY